MKVWIVVLIVLFSCCLNVVFLEAIIKKCPSSGNLITFAQFLFISLEGFVFTADFGRRKPNIPLRKYVTLVIFFFLVNVSNNYALNFHISVPLHIIFRSGSLLANMCLGVLILKRKYSLKKYLSVSLITVGIIMATLASSQTSSSSTTSSSVEYFLGISLLSFALLMSARLGIFQEVLFQTHGKHPKEAVFYQHFLSLPAFIPLLPDIANQIHLFNQSEPSLFSIPALWLFLLVNCVTQYVCIQSVMRMMSECTSLAVTLALTLRKFLSLVISIFYFRNAFTHAHWSATLLVFAGSLLFLEFPVKRENHVIEVNPRLKKSLIDKKSDKSSEEETD